jgi:hypothetical protein
MNEVLGKLVSRSGKVYNPAAKYVARRKQMVDWMCEEGENLKYRNEAIH